MDRMTKVARAVTGISDCAGMAHTFKSRLAFLEALLRMEIRLVGGDRTSDELSEQAEALKARFKRIGRTSKGVFSIGAVLQSEGGYLKVGEDRLKQMMEEVARAQKEFGLLFKEVDRIIKARALAIDRVVAERAPKLGSK